MAAAPSGKRDEISTAPDPRHIFLTAHQVIARYGWGKTKGYENLKNPNLVPPPVMTNPKRWRLDQLLACEDHRIAEARSDLQAVHEPRRGSLEDRLPPPKRKPRRSA